MTAQPWQPTHPSTVRAYHRTDEAGNLLAYVAETGSAWSAYTNGRGHRFATEPEARAHIEAWAKAKGWEVRDAC